MAEKKKEENKEQEKAIVERKDKPEALRNTFADSVMNSINKFMSEKRLVLPTGYSPENALKSAWLKILETKDSKGSKALDVCTPESVGNALLEMAIMGLNPAKNQCYFIVYGNKLTMFPSYFGKITALKRIKGVEGINAQAIYEGDEITYDIQSDGSISNIEHHQSFFDIKEEKILGSYCVIAYEGKEYGTIITMEQIQEAWNKSKTAKEKKEFKSEFAKRTAVNRAIKWFINTRDDEDLLIDTINSNENTHYEYEEEEEEPVRTTVVIDGSYDEKTGEVKPVEESPKTTEEIDLHKTDEEENDSDYVEFE